MKSDPRLTPKQKKVLDFITSFTEKRGYAPSQQEIARHFRFRSLGTVQNYLVRLERHGVLKKSWNAKRSLVAVPVPSIRQLQPPSQSKNQGAPQPPSSVPLPLVGEVAAGYPIEAIEDRREIEVPASFVSKKIKDYFALRVRGNSMIEDGIFDGDLVIIQKQKEARQGQTVVALIDQEATIKKFYHRGKKVELHPANPSYAPIVVEPDRDFQIEGVLVGLIRDLR